MTEEKLKWTRDEALVVARVLCEALKPVTSRLIVAGSLRRRKEMVGDVEVIYIPKMEAQKDDFFSMKKVDLTLGVIEQMESLGILERRKNSRGFESFGPKNKLMRHRGTRIPVDLFSTDDSSWWNYLVCRTGSAETNMRIATAAQAKGWKWNPYGAGFSRGGALAGESGSYVVNSEQAVFEFVGLSYLEPWER